MTTEVKPAQRKVTGATRIQDFLLVWVNLLGSSSPLRQAATTAHERDGPLTLYRLAAELNKHKV